MLPGTDLRVSEICLGTSTFGTEVCADGVATLCDEFVADGGNFFDTAHSYGDWVPGVPRAASERALGEWLRTRPREQVVIATKGCEVDIWEGSFTPRVTPRAIGEDLHGSLDSIGSDYIDLYWLHRDDPSVPVATIVDCLIEYQRQDLIRYFGCSNWSVPRIKEAQDYARSQGHMGFAACEPMWGLASPDRAVMVEAVYCGGYYEDGYQDLHEAGMPMIPYASQSHGFFAAVASLNGLEDLPEDLRSLYGDVENMRRYETVSELAHKYRSSPNAVALAYLLHQPWVTVPIIGAWTLEQLRDSLSACNVPLTDSEVRALRR